MDTSLLRHLQSGNESRVLPPGTVLVDFHAYIKNIPILLRGHVKVVGDDEDGNEIVLYHLGPGESCVMSILGAMNGGESKIKAVTIDETEVIFIRPSGRPRS